ncbi:hypothetical protein FRC04_010680 [Tulasnella sp. 424]|nr:hypothetical protein FRC04_010680 [Tulasnella sp. 424]KAG8972391.1 hypothetical protein FRC05_010102 [Tulasnella sp. 425]
MLFSSLALALFAAVATAAPASQDANAAKAIRGPCIPAVFPGTPPNITAITPGTAVTGLYLSNSDASVAGGAAILSTATTINRLEFDEGTIAAYQGYCSPFYLQIGTSDKSYKPLTWDFTAVDNIWDADFNKIVTAKASGSSEFLACKPLLSTASDPFTLYLQTGTDRPVGACSALTQLKVSKNGLIIPETK